jgi:hypothetical protein
MEFELEITAGNLKLISERNIHGICTRQKIGFGNCYFQNIEYIFVFN